MSTTTPATTQLTDRYVHAVLRSTPEAKRDGLEPELRATIADAVDARIEQGEAPAAAERAALVELGDPARLAAGYADRPLTLIGPALFVSWQRLLILLLAVVPPFVALAVVLGQLIAGAGIGQIIGTTVATTISVVVHLGFWTTLVFAVLERTGYAAQVTTFDPDALPNLPGPGTVRWVETAWSIAMLVLFAVALVGQQSWSPFETAGGDPIPVLDPALWSFWLPWFLALLAAEVVFAAALGRVGRWTPAFAIVNVLLNVAFTVPALWLVATGALLNTEFFAQFDGVDYIQPQHPLIISIAVIVAAVSLWDCIDGVLKTLRGRR